MSLPDGLLNASDVRLDDLAGIRVGDYSGLLAPGVRRGEPVVLPGQDGAQGFDDDPLDAYTFQVDITVLPLSGGVEAVGDQARRAAMLANLAGMWSWLPATGVGVMKRRITTGAATTAVDQATLRYVEGISARFLNFATGATVLRFTNLTGCWLRNIVNEQQTVTLTGGPTGGTFTLSFDGQVTAPIAYNATAAAVRTALEGLGAIEAGDVTVTGGPGPATPWVVVFGGRYAGIDVPQMSFNPNGLTGGTSPNVTVFTDVNGSRTKVIP